MAAITKQELIDAQRDADDLEKILNGAADLNGDGTVPLRLGGEAKTIAKLEAEFDAKIAEQTIQNDTASAALAAMTGLAADVTAAAATVYVPTYLDDISSGNRGATGTNLLTIVTDLAISAGAIAYLINGSAANDDANGVRFATGQDIVGKRLFSITTNLRRQSKLVGKVRIRQSTNAAYGTYQPRVRDMYGAWSNFGGTVAIGGATDYEINLNALAKTGITGFEFVGTAGVTPSNAIRMQEVDIQSVDSPRKGVMIAPATDGLPGDAYVNGEQPDLAPVARPRFNSPASQGGAVCNYEYWFDDSDEILRNRRSALGWFDYSAGTYGKPTKTTKGRKFNKVMASASWAGVREVMILKRCNINSATSETEIGVGVAGNPFYLKGSTYRDGLTVKAIYPNGSIGPVFSQTSGTTQINARFLNRGGWVLLFIQIAADFTGVVSLGGDIDEAGVTTGRATEFEVACIKTWTTALPDDAARLAEADWVCRELAHSRGIRIRGSECSRGRRDIVTIAGESQAGGQALMSDRPKQIREMASLPDILIHSHERADQPYSVIPAGFVAGATSRMLPFDTSPSVGYDGRQAGPEWKVAINHHLGMKPVPLGLLHGGANSSILGGSSALSWLASQPPSTGLLYFHLTRIYDMWRWYLENDIAPIMVSFNWSQGWNNSNLAAAADYYNSYDIYYEDLIAKWLLYTGHTMIKQNLVQLPPLPAGNVTHDPAKFATVQAKLQALVDADPANRSIILPPTIPSNDAWGMSRGYQSDLLHYNAPLLDYQGDAMYTLTPFSAY